MSEAEQQEPRPPRKFVSSRALTFLVLALSAAGGMLALRWTDRHGPGENRCGKGFSAEGARCIPRGETCPPFYAMEQRQCAPVRTRVTIPATTISIGSDDWESAGKVPTKTITVGAFQLDAFEITEFEFRKSAAGDWRAASHVRLSEARVFCKERGGRLPTDDEWTVAASGKEAARYPWGPTGAVCRRAAWGLANGPCASGGNSSDTVGAHLDGDTSASIHDLSGNVEEWVEMPSGAKPSVRGGSWRTSLATELRTWSRREIAPEEALDSVGFRCAYDVAQAVPAVSQMGDDAGSGGVLTVPTFEHVLGQEPSSMVLKDSHSAELVSFEKLSARREPGKYTVIFSLPPGEFIEIPVCANVTRAKTELGDITLAPGPNLRALTPKERTLTIEFEVGLYERRIACGGLPVTGTRAASKFGLGTLRTSGPNATTAAIYIPKNHDFAKAAPVLVGLHPWNGSVWTYLAYRELLDAADENDVLLLFPDGLGNSLYTAPAEAEVLRAIDAMEKAYLIDPKRISLWGASMGGAGATTIGFHHPERFASVTSFFGDSKYDLTTYVKSILHSEADAKKVNAMDALDGAKHLSVWLVHGDADHTSPIAQSQMLADALRARHYQVRFDIAHLYGHEGSIVAMRAKELVKLAAQAKRIE